jgi:betaine-homocysteine S-methyltransferase
VTDTLLERLSNGPVICAEGYLFELERRGYLDPTAFVPEVLLDNPEAVEELHREFVHAGSDVVEAFTYYAHREKLRSIGREADLEKMNRAALAIAREVATATGSLFAGNICNTNVFADDPETRETIRAMFEEQVQWAVEAKVDCIIGETFIWAQEALLALDVIKETGLPAVVTLAIMRKGETGEGWSPEEACKRLEDAGADVVGLNCIRGPRTMLPLLASVRSSVGCYVAALPVPYQTDEDHPSFLTFRVRDENGERNPFPGALEPFACTRYEMADFAREAYDLGVNYLGVCCGGAPHHIRSMAEALGRTPPASRYSFDPNAKRASRDTRSDLYDDLHVA